MIMNSTNTHLQPPVLTLTNPSTPPNIRPSVCTNPASLAPPPGVQYTAHRGHVLSLCLLQAPHLAASCDSFGDLHVWSTATGKQLSRIGSATRSQAASTLNSWASPPHRSSGSAPPLSLSGGWNGAPGPDDASVGGLYSACCAAGWHWPSHVAAASLACCVQLLDTATGDVVSEHLAVPPGVHAGTLWVRCMSCSVGEQWVAAGLSTGAACVVDVRADKGVVARWRPHGSAVTALCAPGGHVLLSAAKVRGCGC